MAYNWPSGLQQMVSAFMEAAVTVPEEVSILMSLSSLTAIQREPDLLKHICLIGASFSSGLTNRHISIRSSSRWYRPSDVPAQIVPAWSSARMKTTGGVAFPVSGKAT